MDLIISFNNYKNYKKLLKKNKFILPASPSSTSSSSSPSISKMISNLEPNNIDKSTYINKNKDNYKHLNNCSNCGQYYTWCTCYLHRT